MAIIDSYSETNHDTEQTMQDLHPSDTLAVSADGQAFTSPVTKYTLTTCQFYLKKSASPTGNATAQLFLATGTVGTNALPTGSALATSGNFDVSTLTTSFALVTFTFSTSYELQPATDYCLLFVNPTSGTVEATNYPLIGMDTSTPTHAGNRCYYWNGAWVASATGDVCFYLYGNRIGGYMTTKSKRW